MCNNNINKGFTTFFALSFQMCIVINLAADNLAKFAALFEFFGICNYDSLPLFYQKRLDGRCPFSE